jgi:type II secretory pathway pseudopilin PulG
MQNRERGFKLLELGIVMVIIAIGIAYAIPRFIISREKAREAEVKSNCHAIQIACERYAVDTGGLYPLFLTGGEPGFNILSAYREMSGNGISRFPVDGVTPYAFRTGSNQEGPRLEFTADPLLLFGYLYRYPANPFNRHPQGINSYYLSEEGSPGVFPYGGRFGDRQFDLGFGWGDTPQTQFVSDSPSSSVGYPGIDAPGNFYYQPLFDDDLPAYWHYAVEYARVHQNDEGELMSELGMVAHYPINYNLHGYGSPTTRAFAEGPGGGDDIFRALPDRENPPENSDLLIEQVGRVLDSSVRIEGLDRAVETTGYLPHDLYLGMADPWYEPVDMYEEEEPADRSSSGADGINDWVIISMSGGGSVVPQEFVTRSTRELEFAR